MTVLHIITGLSIGGAERTLYNLLAGGLMEATDVAVLSLCDEGVFGPRIRDLGVPVYALGMRRGVPTPFAVWRLQRLVKKLRPRVIQGWMYHGNLAASVAAHLATGPRPAVIWNIRQSLYSLTNEKVLTQQVIRANRWLSRGVDAIIYNSHLSRRQHEAFGFVIERGQVIPNGFDTERLYPDPERGRAMRKALRIPEEATVIGHMARFHPMKDHVSFLRAAVEVMKKHFHVICLLAGRDVNLQNSLLSGIVPSNLEERFRFVGERDDVPDLMRTMDVFCLSSAWGEAFPNVLGEAMACGVPCVATDVGDSRYIVGDTGIIVPPLNSSALALGLLEMVRRPKEERAALGRAARARIEERYTLPKVVEQYQWLYKRVLKRGPK